MDIPAKLSQYKNHFVIPILVVCLILAFFSFLAPQFITILSYFWPLFLSTTVFLVAMMIFGQISSHPAEPYGDKAGEGLMDYVSARPEDY
ncbi:P53 apoptosis effector related to PMP-22 like [Actinidia chinensis var. chinensis]|uniref:P53 apoptosis effector related to PMP-22 like n=1 Tax=Actinidia chinensis var. chinensis TaxID=1590841 RepID=A0A2R6RB35_ACTCC|nr:P53 apoptosis effector related to PMP-22 like [Actinidia chinensis var. chinensis]